MAEAGLLLLVHGEVTDAEVDMFDREAVFIETKLVRRRSGGMRNVLYG
jgi:dihydroorotase